MLARIAYSDGRFRLIACDWPTAIDIPNAVWAAYQEHRERDMWWQDAILALDNAKHESETG